MKTTMIRKCDTKATTNTYCLWPRGLMDKASDFESEDCEFESRRGLYIFTFSVVIG